ncbi:MAG: PAS domain-containing protein [Candidatus Ozemobacteraceae bacterium]
MNDQRYAENQIKQALAYVEIFDPADETDCKGCGYNTCREFAVAMLDGSARPSMCVVLSKKVIDKLKKRDRELRESLFFQQELLDAIAVPIFHEDTSGMITGCNGAFESLVGKKLYVFKGQTIDQCIENEAFVSVNRQLNQSLIKSGGRQVVDIRFTLPGSPEQVAELHKSALNDRAGKINGFICLIVDITERVKRNEELALAKELAEMSASLLKKMPSGFVIVDEQLNILDSNPAFAALMGEEIVALLAARPGLIGADLKTIFPAHQLFSTFIQSGQETCNRDIDWEGKKIKLSLYAIERGKTAGAILLDLAAPDVRKEEVRLRAEKVIRENLETVQQIAYLLGENASRTENALSAVIRLFSKNDS